VSEIWRSPGRVFDDRPASLAADAVSAASPGSGETPEHWPMSSAQLRVWLVEELSGGTVANNLSFGLRLVGGLDTAMLNLALQVVVERHAALRTNFAIVDGEPMQLIRRARPAVRTIDLAGYAEGDREREAYGLARREIAAAFDLGNGPLVRLVLLRLRPDMHIMLGVLHHIVCDNWSLGLFVGEIERCYRAFRTASDPGLKPVPLRYVDYAAWQREWFDSSEFARQLAYWTGRLAGAPPLLDLSSGAARPPRPSLAGASQTRGLSPGQLNELRAVAANHSATPFAVSLAVLQLLLGQWSGATDIVVGIPVAGRGSVELEEVIGNFVNLVAIRTDLSGDPPVVDVLRAVRDAIVDALAHQEVPFERLVAALHTARTFAENPIFQVMFASLRSAAPRRSFADLEASPYVVEAVETPFDLSISLIEEAPDVWWLRAEYRTDLFSSEAISGLLEHYFRLLSRVAARPEMPLSQLDDPPGRPVRRGGGGGAAMPAAPEPRSPQPDPPSDRLEEVLAEVWANVLGVRPPGVTANFFDLGGHSLTAVRLIAEIGRVLCRKIPVSIVFQEPTIRSMARHLRGESGSFSSVALLLHEGGARAPFFCAGARHEYREFSRALDLEHPFFQLDVFGLQEERELAGLPLYTSVPDLAAGLRQAICAIQPNGPYFLGGLCEGGIIGLEVALQLQQRGQEVALLAELDTPVTGFWRRHPTDWLHYGCWLLSSGRLPLKIREHLDRSRRRWFPSSPEEERLFRIWRVIWNAIWRYRPERAFDGEIHLFRAPNPRTWFVEDVVIGWDARASRGVRVHQLASEHMVFFLDPTSQRVIAKVIEEASAAVTR
jgi:thioesterase domain-containing protein